MMIRQFIRVRRSDGGNPVNLTGSITFDDGLIVQGVATSAGVLTFEFEESRRLTGVWAETACDGATSATRKRGETNDKDGQSLLWDEDVIIATGVNPFDIPLEELLNFRGSIWTARAPIAYGPRPGQPDNICAMDYFPDTNVFGDADAAVMLEEYCGKRKYRHFPVGPDIAAGYHGQYPDVDFRQDIPGYLKRMQDAYNAGGIPVFFLCPDGWTLDDCKRELEPIYRTPEFQRIVRLAVPHGWEPNGADGGYNISNAEWCAFFEWAQDVFPHAILGLHMISDFDAPIGHDVPPPDVDAKTWAWQNVYAAGCRFFLDQIGGYLNSGPDLDPAFLVELGKRIAYFRQHFADWGLTDLLYIFGEYAAYRNYWQNWPEAKAVELGDWAMANGAQGFLDGGTVR